MTVLAIDPGLASTGYAVVEKTEADSYEILEYGCIKTSPEESIPNRLKIIHSSLKRILKCYKAKILIIEKIYFAKNVKTAFQVGESRGVILLLAAEFNLPVSEYTPLQVKQAVSSFGRASKHQVKEMVKLLFNMEKAPSPDHAADALAIAYTYFQNLRTTNKYEYTNN